MALRTRTIVEQRVSAMKLLEEGIGVSEVAERLGVSRQAIYEWKARYRENPETGLNDRSRRPRTSPTRTSEAIEQRVIEERKQWSFGSKQILRRLQDEEPEVAWPPRSTIDAILKRAGLVPRRKTVRRRFAPVEARRTYEATAAGQVMTADYKGQFRLRNGRYCYPLLVADPVSRYLLACDAFTGISLEQSWATLLRVFREHGLPNMLHTDNGVPFGTSGHGRFSTISVRLMKYGIQPVYNRPGHPEDNGRHERLNKTLMERTTINPAHDNAGQQVLFDEFRRMFNEERPHEGLDLDRPGPSASSLTSAVSTERTDRRVRAALPDPGRRQQGPHLVAGRTHLFLGRVRKRANRLRAHRLHHLARPLRLVRHRSFRRRTQTLHLTPRSRTAERADAPRAVTRPPPPPSPSVTYVPVHAVRNVPGHTGPVRPAALVVPMSPRKHVLRRQVCVQARPTSAAGRTGPPEAPGRITLRGRMKRSA